MMPMDLLFFYFKYSVLSAKAYKGGYGLGIISQSSNEDCATKTPLQDNFQSLSHMPHQ